MYSDELDFVWAKPANGGAYAWTDGKSYGGTVVRVLVQTDAASLVSYSPLNSSLALYREFAQTEPTEEGVLDFVNQYGPLGRGAQKACDIEPTAGGSNPMSVTAEPLSDWKIQLNWIREALAIWDAVQEKDKAVLAERFRWVNDSVVRYYPPRSVSADPWDEIPDEKRRWWLGYDIIGEALNGSELRPTIVNGDVIAPARVFMLNLLNRELPKLVGTVLLVHSKRGKAIRQDRVQSLLGAIYLQFAQAILGQKKPRTCQVCGRWFDVAPGENRKDRVFCSDPCKSQSYRNRKRQARMLAADGKNPKTIAKELDTTVATVKGWINTKLGRK